MRKILVALLGLMLPQLAVADELPMSPLRPDQVTFRALYKNLVETNTTQSTGSCTLAAQRMAAHLKEAGFVDRDLNLFNIPGHPTEGGLVAILHGSSRAAKPILLLGHLDVVEANRDDWKRDPFTLIEESNYFFARGASDDKAMDAIWVDALSRFKQENYLPKRDIKLALTCDEETGGEGNGARWLTEKHPDWISAAFALNEGGGGRTDGHGKVMVQSIQVGEKSYRDFRIETTNPGGHSSVPVRANAIYELAQALLRVRDYEFPMHMNDTTRAYFAKAGAVRGGEMGQAMIALANNRDDKSAEAEVSTDPSYHSMLRTTCVGTMLDGGSARNALPERAGANINCRILPGETQEQTMAALVKAIDDPGVRIEVLVPHGPVPIPPPLDTKVLEPAEKLVTRYYPGVPLIPSMSTGATDGVYLEAIGIPVYGVPGGWIDPDGNGVHGVNERRGVRSLYVGRDFLTDLVKAYAESE